VTETAGRFGGLGISASLILHLAGFWALGNVPATTSSALTPSMVDFEVAPPRAQPEPEPEPEAEPEPEPEPASEPAAAAPKEAAEEESAADPEPVADLTGLTLTNAGSAASWQSAVGNGKALAGPIRSGKPASPAQAKSASVDKSAGPPGNRQPAGPPIVAASDLSSRPVPPNLNGVLQSHYPERAREMGLEGSAVVRLRIDADGRVRVARVESESDSGFGSACRQTVLGSHWSAPRDRDGKSVATFVKYTCRFRVGH
jgi:TonB family protein